MKLSWGILSTANIATEQVIPAMQAGEYSKIKGIASRNLESARQAAMRLDIEKFYASYEDLLADPDIQAIYNPLPNHLHKEWSIKALRAGKHLLCEKPLALTIEDVKELIAVQKETGLVAGEAFMVASHPQYTKAKEIMDSGELGEIRAYQCVFTYHNTNPQDIRNKPEYGGGGLWDIGCYPVYTSRRLLGREPEWVIAKIDWDPDFGVDRSASVIMDYDGIQASFFVSTQAVNRQSILISGTKASLEIEIPFNAPSKLASRIFISKGDLYRREVQTMVIPSCNQYTLQGDAFSKAVLKGAEAPVPFEDSLKNTAVILSAFESDREGRPVKPADLLA